MSVHRTAVLLLAWVTGCASGRVVRLETDRGPPVVFTPHSDGAGPMEVERHEFKTAVARLARELRPPANPQQAARHLMGEEARGGAYLFNERTRQLTPLDGAALASDMGQNAARAFALLATVAVGHTAAGFASKVPTLPGSAQAAALAGGRAGIRLVAVGEVGAVAVSGEAVTVALAPNAVAMTARAMGGRGCRPGGRGGP